MPSKMDIFLASPQSVPFSYFISLKMGDKEFGNVDLVDSIRDPYIIQSLKVNRKISMAPHFGSYDEYMKARNEYEEKQNDPNNITDGLIFTDAVFTLSAAVDLSLEKQILDYLVKCMDDDGKILAPVSFRYGYVNGPSTPEFHGSIYKVNVSSDFYTLTMYVHPVNLTKEGSSNDSAPTSYVQFTEETLDKLKGEFTKYSDVVKIVAESQKWEIGEIKETTEIDPNDIDKPTNAMNPWKYVQTKLVPNALSADKQEGNYKAYFRFDENNILKFYYMPSSFNKDSYNYRNLKNYNFFIRMLPNGKVLSFQPQLLDLYSQAVAIHNANKEGKTNTNVFGVITKDTKELQKIGYEVNTQENNNALNTKQDQVKSASQTYVMLNASADTAQQMAEGTLKDNINDYAYSICGGSKASMSILGDPEIQCMDLINVIPMFPASNAFQGGVMHPSGGTYLVLGVTDTIGGGNYTTALELNKINDAISLTVSQAAGSKEEVKE